MMEIYWMERKINKGTDKLEAAESKIHNTTCGTQGLYLISNF